MDKTVTDDFEIVQVLDIVDNIGEDSLNDILSDFSCPMNREIDIFLKRNAVDFARKKMSITHLVFNEDRECVAYFTLTHKPVTINADMLSKNLRKKMEKHAKYDTVMNAYTVSAFLIAQFGKNYAVNNGEGISGIKLMDLVYDRLTDVQHEIGGGVVFLECEEKEKLLNFYQNPINGFRIFGDRYSESDGTKYIQLLRFL